MVQSERIMGLFHKHLHITLKLVHKNSNVYHDNAINLFDKMKNKKKKKKKKKKT
jgi:hypothetical protein